MAEKDGFSEKAKRKNKPDSSHSKKNTKNDADRYDPNFKDDGGRDSGQGAKK